MQLARCSRAGPDASLISLWTTSLEIPSLRSVRARAPKKAQRCCAGPVASLTPFPSLTLGTGSNAPLGLPSLRSGLARAPKKKAQRSSAGPVAPLGLEPRLSSSRVRRVASYTKGQRSEETNHPPPPRQPLPSCSPGPWPTAPETTPAAPRTPPDRAPSRPASA